MGAAVAVIGFRSSVVRLVRPAAGSPSRHYDLPLIAANLEPKAK